MYLEMHIGNLEIDKVSIDLSGCETLGQRENYINDVVHRLYKKHRQKIIVAQAMPVFYIDNVPSKMNVKKCHSKSSAKTSSTSVSEKA